MNIVANITSKFGTKAYHTVPVPQVENYSIDSALDTDTDQYSIDIGDPTSQLVTLLNRDSEVRIGLKAATRGSGLVSILQGYADLIALRHDGVLSIQGRDLSSAAVDTTAIPFSWRNARPEKIIADQAYKLGFAKNKVEISPISVIPKFNTDGSESEWDVWYRMVRRKQMWIWCDSNGTLHVDNLNYASKPSYYFGEPTKEVPDKNRWIRVQEAEISKNTQTRLGEVLVFGETGKKAFEGKSSDPNIADWIKKPLKIITASQGNTNRAQAIKDAQEEIFEGIVGALEISITISDPGFPIKQNTVAMLNLPTMDYRGEFFVVGIKILNGTNGAIQQIRLREKKYALTRRVPKSPQLKETRYNISSTAFGANLNLPNSKPWGEFFIKSARAWHGPWDLNLFLAALLSICKHESTFRNVRERGSVEWYPAPPENASSPQKPDRYGTWQREFANKAGNPLNPFSREAGVGPMQLTDAQFKTNADNYLGIRGEYTGGRWYPEANIWEAGSVLIGKLQGLTVSDANFRLGLQRYNGSGPAAVAYGNAVWEDIKQNWLPIITAAEAATQNISAEMASQLQDISTSPNIIKKIIAYAWSKRGDPYSWGATGPNRFDCSGLVWASYNAAGLSGRIGGRDITTGYWAGGKSHGNFLKVVEKNQLLPADMVFFDNFSSNEAQPAHMGLYYSRGQMIVAPHTGSDVQVQSISEGGLRYMGGMRLKGLWPSNPSQDPIHPGPN